MEDVYMAYCNETGTFIRSGKYSTPATYTSSAQAQAQVTKRHKRSNRKFTVVKITEVEANF